jgi:hypothetical protein
MKANEITKGGHYRMKVNGTVQTVRVDEIRKNYAGRTVYDVTNLATGRKTMARSAAKFRGPATDKALYLERITGDAEVKPAFSVAEVNARQGREMEEAIGQIPEDKRLVTPTPESEAFEAMFEI